MEKKSPLDAKEIKEKIDKGEVKVAGKASKGSKPTTGVTGVKGKITDTNIIKWLKKQNGAVTSTELRNGLGFKSRTQARRVLRRLAKAKKVIISQRKLSEKRQVFTFVIA